MDYYSRFPEVTELTITTSQGVMNALHSIFARHGIPEILMSDNGAQYSSQGMKDFSYSYGFKHITSCPYCPQSNRKDVIAEKQLLIKNKG